MLFKEIERKWTLRDIPRGCMNLLEYHVSRQAYLYADDNLEVRLYIRYDGATYGTMMPHVNRRRLTIKFGNGLVREEAEIELTEEQAAKLIGHIKQPYITKVVRIYGLQYGNEVLKFETNEVDPTKDTGFMYGEIEFRDEDQAKLFNVPSFLEKYILREVTGENYFAMKNYWRRTRLENT